MACAMCLLKKCSSTLARASASVCTSVLLGRGKLKGGLLKLKVTSLYASKGTSAEAQLKGGLLKNNESSVQPGDPMGLFVRAACCKCRRMNTGCKVLRSG